VTRVHQVLSAAGPYDAVSGQALAWREVLAGRGLAGGIHADAIDPRARGIDPVQRLDPDADDLLVLHYSAFAPRLAPVIDLPQRKLLVYHNVTPARYLWNHHPGVAVACALGRGQLPRYVRAARVAAAVSAFNAREVEAAGGLREGEARVVPNLFDRGRLEERDAGSPEGPGPLVLVVGRLVPQKRHDLVLAAFTAYQRACEPDARLLCVGEPLSPSYRELMERLARESGARNVSIAGGVPQPELNAAYAAADVMLSMSAHEGFCIPLLEAFHFDLPVVARPAGAMPEIGGDAVLWLDGDEADPAVAAELIDLAVRDSELRGELSLRGRTRLAEYSYERTSEAIAGAVEAALA
jgi:glycosyltransferase involved in cell wall biosynthesis